MNEHLDADSLQYWITLLEDPSTSVEIYYWAANVEIVVNTPESCKATEMLAA